MRKLELSGPLRLFAPAKLNLGLEVVGLRPDGYHEVVTILQTVSLFDVIDLHPAPHLSYEGSTAAARRDDDLLWRALSLAHDELSIDLAVSVRLEKHIPVAAGLGGGSSDAGTLLGAIASLASLPRADVERAAASLGSDVPFFVQGGTALATGTGIELEPLPDALRIWFIVAVPRLEIGAKTATLYHELTPGDYSNGSDTRRQADRISSGARIDVALLRNAFTSPLLRRQEVAHAARGLQAAGVGIALPSGAGPAIYAPAASFTEARQIAATLTGGAYRVMICTTIAAGLTGARLTQR